MSDKRYNTIDRIMEVEKCPFCGSTDCEIKPLSDWNGNHIICKKGYEAIVNDTVNIGDEIEVKRRYNIIFSLLLLNPYKVANTIKYKHKFFYEIQSIGEPIDVFNA